MKFVDIHNGKTYNGDKPYIHWLGDNCSVNLIYNKPICFITKKPKVEVEVSSDVFFLINLDKDIDYERINDFYYKDIDSLKTKHLISKGEKYDDNIYIHIIYIGGCLLEEIECIEDFIIDGVRYNIGINAYDSYENNIINLSNLGVNISNNIQKSLYDSNVHEDSIDNVLLNRKWRELLTNYWNIIANRGSYKSMINSLKWFDWGDQLKLKEMWGYNDLDNINRLILEDREIKEYSADIYLREINNFYKTTYIGLNFSMQKLTGKYDKYKNPIIKEICTKWTKTDLMLKLSLLAEFYKRYFLPIHINIIHATIEDITFADLFKQINSDIFNREDYKYDVQTVKCNIKNDDVFYLSNISAQVNENVLFGKKYSDEDEYNIISMGVNDQIDIIKNDNDLKTFMTQNFNGICVVVPVQMKINLIDDFIKNSKLSLKIKDNWEVVSDRRLFFPDDSNQASIDFKLIFFKSGLYEIKSEFISGSSRVFAKNISISIEDPCSSTIKLYKVEHLNEKKLDISYWSNNINDYLNNRFPSQNNHIQYISLNVDKRGKGIALNNVLIFKQKYESTVDIIDFKTKYKWIKDNYFVNIKNIKNNKTIYTICISKSFWFDPSRYIGDLNQYIYRNDYGFFPEFHELKEIKGNNLQDYTITDSDNICLIPMLQSKNNNDIYFKYGEQVAVEWKFKNISTDEEFEYKNSIKEPFMFNPNNKFLSKGYYDVFFTYKIGKVKKTIIVNSAFLKA